MKPVREIPPSVMPNIGVEYNPSPTRRTCPPACSLSPSSLKTVGKSSVPVPSVVSVVVSVPLAERVCVPKGVGILIVASMLKTTPGIVIIPLAASKFPPGPGLFSDMVTSRLAPAKLAVGNMIVGKLWITTDGGEKLSTIVSRLESVKADLAVHVAVRFEMVGGAPTVTVTELSSVLKLNSAVTEILCFPSAKAPMNCWYITVSAGPLLVLVCARGCAGPSSI